MSSHSIKQDMTYTYKDYQSWADDERWELIHGTAYAMTAPSRQHQEILQELFLSFGNYLKGKPCRVYIAPFDVRLPSKEETEQTASTVVQPDLVVICDMSKLDNKGCKGSPDLVIEILSPTTARHDVIKKRRLYEQSGILEYWIVDPSNQIINRFYLDGIVNEYRRSEYFSRNDIISPIILPELKINLEEIFPEIEEQD